MKDVEVALLVSVLQPAEPSSSPSYKGDDSVCLCEIYLAINLSFNHNGSIKTAPHSLLFQLGYLFFNFAMKSHFRQLDNTFDWL